MTQISGYSGLIIKITDAGWVFLRDQSHWHPIALTAPNSNDIYIAGYDDPQTGENIPVITYSHNAGQTWESATLPAGIKRINDIHFTGGTGWAVGTTGEKGLLLKSTDAGQTWNIHRNFGDAPHYLTNPMLIGGPSSQRLYAVQSVYNNSWPCYHGACPGVVIESTDSGENWHRVEQLSGIWAEQLAVTESNSSFEGVLLGHLGVVPGSGIDLTTNPYKLKLTSSMNAAPSPVLDGVEQGFKKWQGLDIVSEQRWWTAALGEANSASAWHTADGGTSWNQSPFYMYGGDIAAIDSSNVWAINYDFDGVNWIYNPKLVTTTNGGQLWIDRAIPMYSYGDVSKKLKVSLDRVDTNHGCFSDHHVVQCTSDGWATSHRSAQVCSNNALDISLVNQGTGYVLCSGNDLTVQKTTDGGHNWQQAGMVEGQARTKNEKDNLQPSSIVFQTEAQGWISDHNLWETEDGGVTWTRSFDGIHPPKDLGISLLDVTKNGTDTGWAGTPGGTLLRLLPWHQRTWVTTDGGMIASADGGRLVVRFPAGSLSTAAEAMLTVYEPAADAAHIYELTLSPQTQLHQPIELTAQYQPDQLTASSGADTPQLAQWRNGQWEPLADSQYNPTTGEITASADEPGFFAIRESSSNVGKDGDVNCDRETDGVDALFISQFVVEHAQASEQCPPPEDHLYVNQCDVSGEGVCDVVDAILFANVR